jgi:hypothetical protein
VPTPDGSSTPKDVVDPEKIYRDALVMDITVAWDANRAELPMCTSVMFGLPEQFQHDYYQTDRIQLSYALPQSHLQGLHY